MRQARYCALSALFNCYCNFYLFIYFFFLLLKPFFQSHNKYLTCLWKLKIFSWWVTGSVNYQSSFSRTIFTVTSFDRSSLWNLCQRNDTLDKSRSLVTYIWARLLIICDHSTYNSLSWKLRKIIVSSLWRTMSTL